MYRPAIAYNGTFTIDTTPHTPDELLLIVQQELSGYVKVKTVKNKETIEYYNIPAGFDIETYSWEENGEKFACHVCWQFGINGHVCIGRTYDEFMDFHEKLKNLMGLSNKCRLILYVHNLGYEFQWYRKRLNFTKVFALDSRKPAYAYEDGYEWKDSLILTGCTLEKSAEDLTKYNIKKLDTWEYDKPRHHKTPLTPDEINYAMFDVLVVMAIIKEKMDQENGWIVDIPMTRTGYVRRDCKQNTIKKSKLYRNLIMSLKIDPDEYQQLKRAFMGGFTHANHNYVGLTNQEVGAFDFTSSYPAVMVCEKFPMGRVNINPPGNQQELEDIFKNYCCLFDIQLTNVRPHHDHEHVLSLSKCYAENA